MEKVVDEAVVDKDGEMMLNPYEYFQSLKEKVQDMDDKKLNKIYENALCLAEQYKKTGQKKGLRKLLFHLESIIKEKEVLNYGITKFIYREDIEEYIENVASKQVVILDIASYERAIPEEIVEVMEKVKDLFDEFYVVCTDYTGKISKQVNKERREKDPILFGVFLDRSRNAINERFYYIGDWIDENCDLTLDKLVSEMRDSNKTDILKEMTPSEMPLTVEDLKTQLNNLHLNEVELDDDKIKLTLLSEDSNKKSFFSKVKTFLGVKDDKR